MRGLPIPSDVDVYASPSLDDGLCSLFDLVRSAMNARQGHLLDLVQQEPDKDAVTHMSLELEGLAHHGWYLHHADRSAFDLLESLTMASPANAHGQRG